MRFLSLVAAFIILYTPILNAQDFNFDGDTMTVVFESNLDKKKLHSTIYSAIANIYNSAKDVVHMNDSAAGKIIIKSVFNLELNNHQNKAIFSKDFKFPPTLDIDVEHTINIYVKDNKYKLKMDIGLLSTTHLGQRYPLDHDHIKYLQFNFLEADEVEAFKNMHIQTLNTFQNSKKIIQSKETLYYLEAVEEHLQDHIKQLRATAKSIAIAINSKSEEEVAEDIDW